MSFSYLNRTPVGLGPTQNSYIHTPNLCTPRLTSRLPSQLLINPSQTELGSFSVTGGPTPKTVTSISTLTEVSINPEPNNPEPPSDLHPGPLSNLNPRTLPEVTDLESGTSSTTPLRPLVVKSRPGQLELPEPTKSAFIGFLSTLTERGEGVLSRLTLCPQTPFTYSRALDTLFSGSYLGIPRFRKSTEDVLHSDSSSVSSQVSPSSLGSPRLPGPEFLLVRNFSYVSSFTRDVEDDDDVLC